MQIPDQKIVSEYMSIFLIMVRQKIHITNKKYNRSQHQISNPKFSTGFNMLKCRILHPSELFHPLCLVQTSAMSIILSNFTLHSLTTVYQMLLLPLLERKCHLPWLLCSVVLPSSEDMEIYCHSKSCSFSFFKFHMKVHVVYRR